MKMNDIDGEVKLWNDMYSAPKDGTMVCLLVYPGTDEDDGWTSFEDSLEAYQTIGFNSLSDTMEDEWQFAGWDWSHDCFTDGAGDVIGWLPFDVLVDKDRLRAANSALAFYKEQSEKAGTEIDRLTTRVAELDAECQQSMHDIDLERKRAEAVEARLATKAAPGVTKAMVDRFIAAQDEQKKPFAAHDYVGGRDDFRRQTTHAALEAAFVPSTRGSNDDK